MLFPRSNFHENVLMALDTLWQHKVRSFLTVLGVVVGTTTVIVIAAARPAAIVMLPSQRGTVLLAMDVSGSMRAADVEPDRITASQDAAKTFVASQPRTTRVGIVAFAGTAMLVQPPTLEREEVTKSGIVLPDTAKEKPQQGEVLAVGPGRTLDTGERSKPDVKQGLELLFDLWNILENG